MIQVACIAKTPKQLNGLQDDDPVKRMEGVSKIEGVTPYALEEETAKRLWTLSEELTGITFQI